MAKLFTYLLDWRKILEYIIHMILIPFIKPYKVQNYLHTVMVNSIRKIYINIYKLKTRIFTFKNNVYQKLRRNQLTPKPKIVEHNLYKAGSLPLDMDRNLVAASLPFNLFQGGSNTLSCHNCWIFCIIILLIYISNHSKICNFLIVQRSYLFHHYFFIFKSLILLWIKVLSMNNLRYLLCEKDLPKYIFSFSFLQKEK